MRHPPFKRDRDRGIPTHRLAVLLPCPAGRHYAVGDAAGQAGAPSRRSVGCPRAAGSPRASRCAAGVARRDSGVYRANAGRGHERRSERRPPRPRQGSGVPGGWCRGATAPRGGVADRGHLGRRHGWRTEPQDGCGTCRPGIRRIDERLPEASPSLRRRLSRSGPRCGPSRPQAGFRRTRLACSQLVSSRSGWPCWHCPAATASRS